VHLQQILLKHKYKYFEKTAKHVQQFVAVTIICNKC